MGLFRKARNNSDYEVEDTAASEGGILAELWRVILKDTGKVSIVPLLVENAHRRQLKKNSEMPDVVKVQSKSQMLTNAKSKSMSFKVFISLLSTLLCIKKIRITLELVHADGKSTIHQVERKLSEISDEDIENKNGDEKIVKDIIENTLNNKE